MTNTKHKKSSIGVKYFENRNEIILIGGFNRRASYVSQSCSMYDVFKNQFIEYPQTLQQHSFRPGIIIENNNLIHVIGNEGSVNNTWGVIECYDIRDSRWFLIDELNKILNITNEECNKRWFSCVLNSN